jgi:hypothetical protein
MTRSASISITLALIGALAAAVVALYLFNAAGRQTPVRAAASQVTSQTTRPAFAHEDSHVPTRIDPAPAHEDSYLPAPLQPAPAHEDSHLP